jgi:hypothetical protein
VSRNDFCDPEGGRTRGHARLIPVPGHQHHGDAVIQGFGHDTMPRVADQEPTACEHRRMGHELLNPGIGRDRAEFIAGMPGGERYHDANGMCGQGLEGGPGQRHFPRLGVRTHRDQHPRRSWNVEVRRGRAGPFPPQRPHILVMPR